MDDRPPAPVSSTSVYTIPGCPGRWEHTSHSFEAPGDLAARLVRLERTNGRR